MLKLYENFLCVEKTLVYREIKIDKEIRYLENNTDNAENKDFMSFMFSFGNACYCKAYVHRD